MKIFCFATLLTLLMSASAQTSPRFDITNRNPQEIEGQLSQTVLDLTVDIMNIVPINKNSNFFIVKARPSPISAEGAPGGLEETYLQYDLLFKSDDYRLLLLEGTEGVRVICSTRVLMEGTQFYPYEHYCVLQTPLISRTDQ